ncbi:hypothetical protein GYH30_009882 [Glycine max]|nr:hypothetical protein GYH30_009882 [Glycine max]
MLLLLLMDKSYVTFLLHLTVVKGVDEVLELSVTELDGADPRTKLMAFMRLDLSMSLGLMMAVKS